MIFNVQDRQEDVSLRSSLSSIAPPCHPSLPLVILSVSEESRFPARQILCCAQDDNLLPILVVKNHYRRCANKLCAYETLPSLLVKIHHRLEA